jgi:peptidoglycan/LPS O-acetylase OafA/YrhL
MDLSYGIYIFGWPITQTLIWLSPGLPILPLEAEAIVITVAVATLSWIAIEKPTLARRGKIATVLRSWRDRSAWASSPRSLG